MLRRLTRQSRLSLRKKVPGHSTTLLVVTGCAMSVGELYPSVGALQTRQRQCTTLRGRGSHDAPTPETPSSTSGIVAGRYAYCATSHLLTAFVSSLLNAPPHVGSPCGTLFLRLSRCTLRSRRAGSALATFILLRPGEEREVFDTACLTQLLTSLTMNSCRSPPIGT